MRSVNCQTLRWVSLLSSLPFSSPSSSDLSLSSSSTLFFPLPLVSPLPQGYMMLISLFMFVLIHNVFLFFRKSHLLCLALLTLGFTFTYSTNMILAEVFFDRLGGLLPFVLVNSHGHSNTTNNCFRSQLAFSENPFILTHMQAILSNHPLNHHQNVFIKMFIINVNKKSSGEILSRHNPPPPLTSRHIHQVQKHKSDPKNFCPFVSNMKN